MRLVKRVALGLVALVIVAMAAAITKFYILSPKMRPAQEMHAKSDPETLKRGEYLARHVFVCTGCHSKVHMDLPGDPEDEASLGVGRDFGDYPDLFPGRIRSRNLTSDKNAGIGGWTDGEVVRAMREGVSRDGTSLFPIMPYPVYAKSMSDDDALAVVAYLRSLPPSSNDPGRMEVNFPLSMFARAVPKPLVTSPQGAPTSGDARGEWLLDACSCEACHSTVNRRHEPLPGMYLAGGNEFPIAGKGKVYIANITSDKETGIGSWTDDEVLEAIKHGTSKTKPNRALYGMPWPAYGGMTDDDLKALVGALRRVAPVRNAVKASELKL
jgi:hypothetical protein